MIQSVKIISTLTTLVALSACGKSVSESPLGSPSLAGTQANLVQPINGKDGKSFTFCKGGPDAAKGNEGDSCQDPVTGVEYNKQNSIWVVVGSNKGPQGDPGKNGKDGKDGAPGLPGVAGPVGPAGPAGPVGPAGPAGNSGNNGANGNNGKPGDDGLDKQRTQCDALRTDIKTEYVENAGADLVKMLDRVYKELTQTELAQLKAATKVLTDNQALAADKDAAYKSYVEALKPAMERLGMKTEGQFFGDVQNVSSKNQTYLGFARKYGVLAGVHREMDAEGTVTAMKFNWNALDDYYYFSMHVLIAKAGETLNDRYGVPQQDLRGTSAFAGNLYDYIETNSRMVNCRGITHMDKHAQIVFSWIRAGQTQ